MPRDGSGRAAPLPLWVLLATGACAAHGVEPATPTPQRPTVSADTATTAAGTFELEAGVAHDPGDATGVPATLKYGLDGRTEVFAGAPLWQDLARPGDDAEGPGDVDVGVRHRLQDGGPDRPSLAGQMAVRLPAGDAGEGLGSGEPEARFAAISAFDLGRDATAVGFYQLGFLGEPASRGVDVEQTVAGALGLPLAAGWNAFGEVAGILAPARGDEQWLATGGLQRSLGSHAVLDAAVVGGLSDTAPDLQIVFGITVNFGGARPVRTP